MSVICLSSPALVESAQPFKKMKEIRTTPSAHSPDTPFHFTSYSTAAEQILQPVVKFYNESKKWQEPPILNCSHLGCVFPLICFSPNSLCHGSTKVKHFKI